MKTRPSVALLLLALLAVVVLIGAYLFGPARFWFSSDDAVRCVMAEVAARQGRYLPRDWTFVNGDLPLLPPYAVNVLVYPILGVSFRAHAAASFVTFLLLMASVAAFCQSAYGDLETTLVTTLLAASGLSAFTLYFLIAQGGPYASHVAFSLCLFGLALDGPFAARRHPWRRAVFVALLALLLTVTNPVRAAFLTLAPLALSLAVAWVSRRRSEAGTGSHPAGFTGFVVPVGVGALCGTWFYRSVLLPSVTNVNAVATTRMAPLGTMAEHLRALPGDWVAFLQPMAARGPASAFETVLSLGGGTLALALVASVGLGLWRVRGTQVQARSAAWLAAFSTALPLAALVVSGSLYRNFAAIRYAMLGIVLSVPVMVHTTTRALCARSWARIASMTLLAAFSIALAAQWHSARHTPDHLVVPYRERQALIETLVRQKVRLALVSYWNSHVLSALSRGALHAFPVAVTENGLVPHDAFGYLGSDLDVASGPSAIALSDAEVKTAGVWEGVRKQFGPPRQEARSGPFRVWIYDDPRLHWVLGAGPRIDAGVPESRLKLEVERKRLGGPCARPAGCTVRLQVRNGGLETLSSRGDRPFRIAIQALDRAGRTRPLEVARASFGRALAPGDAAEIAWHLPRNEDPETVDYRICLLQEPSAWLCHRTRPFEDAATDEPPVIR